MASYGKLLYYDRKTAACLDDPNRGRKVLPRLGKDDCIGKVRFIVPEDKTALSLEESNFTYKLQMPTNYVPDNDVCAKMVKKLEVSILDNRLFSSFDDHEYTFFNQFALKLNVSPLAQDCELFSQGRFDHHESDSTELTRLLPRNGLTLAENRQQYAARKWVPSKTRLAFQTGGAALSYDIQTDEYEFRAPIVHGLAKQGRVMPPGARLQLEVTLAQHGRCLMELDSKATCRIPLSEAQQVSWPINARLESATSTKTHATKDGCDCSDSKYDSGEYVELEEILKIGGPTPYTKAEYRKAYDKTTAEAFRPHKVEYKHFLYVPDGEHAIFKMDYTLNSKDTMEPIEYSLESVFCMNSSKEQSLLTTGTKGVGAIPFYYPSLKRKILEPGLRVYTDIEISTGPLPKMLVLTGLSHDRFESCDFQKTVTKTQLNENGFKIKSFTIFRDYFPAFCSTWTSAHQHYLNFMKHNGRWANKAVAMGQDFFGFRDECWMVPLFFDDHVGNTGHISLRIEFEETLTERWNLLHFHVPVNELHLDSKRLGKSLIVFSIKRLFLDASVMQKSAVGRKSKRGDLDSPECIKKPKKE